MIRAQRTDRLVLGGQMGRLIFQIALSLLLLNNVYALTVTAAHASETADCAWVELTQAKTCDKLKARIDISRCPGHEGDKSESDIHCEGKTAAVVLVSGQKEYSATIRRFEGSEGNVMWAAEGTVQVSEVPPEPVKAVAPPPKPVAVQAAAPAPAPAPPPPALPAAPPAAVAIAPPQAPPPASSTPAWLNRFSLIGAARFRAEGQDHPDYVNAKDFAAVRARAGLLFNGGEMYQAYFEPQAVKIFGERVGTQKTSGTTYDNTIGLHQLWIAFQPWRPVQLTVGRLLFAYGNELIVGAADWDNIGRSFDGAKLRLDLGTTSKPASLDLFASKIVDTNITASGAGDSNFYGAYATASPHPWLKAIDLYCLFFQDATVSPTSEALAVGLRMQSEIGPADYRIELTKETGSATSDGYEAYQGDAELGASVTALGIKTRLSAEGFKAGRNYYSFYPTGHKWLGIVDVLGRRNVMGGALHLSFDAPMGLSLVADGHLFWRSQTDGPAYKLDGTTAIGSATGSAAYDLGQELDVTLKYKIVNGLVAMGGVGFFLPGAYFTDQYAGVNPRFGFLQLEAKF